MEQSVKKIRRIKKLAGLITESRLLENEISQVEDTADKVADKLEDKVAQLSPEQINQLKADLDKLGITADTPAEEVVDKIEGTLSEAEGDEKQKIAYALSDAGGGLMKSMLVPLIPLVVGNVTGLGFLGGLGITIATAGLLLGLAKSLGAENPPKKDELSEIKKSIKEKISLQKLAGIVNEVNIPKANAHPWVINAMEELKSSLDINLNPQKDRVDFDEITQLARNLISTIKKYR